MSFDKREWELFSCDSLFEPATFSSHGGVDKDKHVELKSIVSMTGTKSVEVCKQLA